MTWARGLSLSLGRSFEADFNVEAEGAMVFPVSVTSGSVGEGRTAPLRERNALVARKRMDDLLKSVEGPRVP
jgi:hypothetical protein